MTNVLSPKDFPWGRSRYGFALWFCFSLLIAFFVLRVVLFAKFGFKGAGSFGTVVQMFLIGFHRDVVVALIMTLPLLFWFWLMRDKRFEKTWHRIFMIAVSFLFWFVQIFIFFVEYFFFDEFKSRFNTVAVDYLRYPHEVAGNIWESYPLPLFVSICVVLSAAWVVLTFRFFRQMWYQPTYAGTRFIYFASATALSFLLWLTLSLQGSSFNLPARISFSGLHQWLTSSVQDPHFSDNRTINEIANNGSIAFAHAFLTGNLDYGAFYKTLPRDDAYARVRKMLAAPNVAFFGDKYDVRRKVAGDTNRPQLNVVILLEESLGSEFWGCLGRKETLTPNMDKLAAEEGMLFANLYASGNRTVRGFEGVFSSFPPLPGESIVKRDRSQNVESIARIFKRDGYNTVFLYGGRGIFDGMRSYALNNGWDRFLDHNPPLHSDFSKVTFSTIWGVCDEDLYALAIQEFRKLHETGKPFFGTALTVSNHKPYTYPPGRIPDDGKKPSREKVVRYTDWCLGKFFEKVRLEPFWTNTIFVVVADHGARVYGRQNIPIKSYEIPMVILGPAVVKGPQRIETLGNSLDVAPTILGMIGRPYDTLFFGRDLFQDPPDSARALLNHNRDIGMFAHDRMVVLGLQKSVEFYDGNPKVVDVKAPPQVKPEFLELEKDATAIYQVADELYMGRRYRIDAAPPTNAPPVDPQGPRIIFGTSTNKP